MMGSLFVPDPPYSLQPSQKYPTPRHTMKLGVPYYVKGNFQSDYQGSITRLEASIEEEYVTNLQHTCFREKNYKETMLWRARNFGDSASYERAKKITTPACETLQKLYTVTH